MKKQATIGAVLAIIAVILLALTFVMPWYNVSAEAESDGERMSMDMDIYFNDIRTTTRINGETETEREDFPEEEDEITKVFHTTRIFVIIAIIGMALGFVGALLVSMDKLSHKIGAILVLIGFIFAIIAPVYMMVQLPNAFAEEGGEEYMGESFFGSDSEERGETTMDISWGGTFSWFMSLIAGVLGVIALIMVLKTKSGAEPTGQAYYHQQQQGQTVQTKEEQWGTQEPQPQQQTNTCPGCGQPTRYIQEYNRRYCDSCRQYK